MTSKTNLTLRYRAMIGVQPGICAIKIIITYHKDNILCPERIIYYKSLATLGKLRMDILFRKSASAITVAMPRRLYGSSPTSLSHDALRTIASEPEARGEFMRA